MLNIWYVYTVSIKNQEDEEDSGELRDMFWGNSGLLW